jgi:SAM-dependent methyltransferase
MQSRKSDPYAMKSTFFDDQVRRDWATKVYGLDERRKLDRLFAITGPLTVLRLLEPGCGTGRLTELLAREVGASGYVVAADRELSLSFRFIGKEANSQLSRSF